VVALEVGRRVGAYPCWWIGSTSGGAARLGLREVGVEVVDEVVVAGSTPRFGTM